MNPPVTKATSSVSPPLISRLLKQQGFVRQRIWVLGIPRIYDTDPGFKVTRGKDGTVEVRAASKAELLKIRSFLSGRFAVRWVPASTGAGTQPWPRLFVSPR